jgi:plasmid segregation protein ParM
MKVAIDIGYGDTKVVYKNSNGEIKYFKFPSAVERVTREGLNFTKSDSNILSFKGLKYRVGKDVILNPYDTRDIDFLTDYSPLLVYKALDIISKTENTKDIYENELAIGLSILNWNKNKEYIDALSDFIINDKKIINEISLFAQGQGVYIDNSDKITNNDFVIIIDIGFNTLDVIVFKKGIPIKEFSYGIEFGTYRIIQELQDKVEKEFGFPIQEMEAKNILLKDGIVEFYGNKKNFKNSIKESKKIYSKELIQTFKNKSKDILRNANTIIMSGGGAYYLNKETLYENIIFGDAPYEFSNAKGYLKGMLNG